jgi:MurNAc alpha-1-phosphate uridylyltransferase
VVGAGAEVHGTLERSVVWPGGVVRPGEHLVDAVRVGDWLTVLVR